MVVFDRPVPDEIMALVPAAIRRIDVGKMPGCHRVPQDGINRILVDLAREGLCVAAEAGARSPIFGRGSEASGASCARRVLRRLHVPGITAAQGAASSTGVPLTHRGLAIGALCHRPSREGRAA